MNNDGEKQKKLTQINTCFYRLIRCLRKEKFDFCAYIVEQAYILFAKELEKRLDK